MVEAQAILQENQQLKAALQLRERSRAAVATGRVVGSSFESPRRFAILSVGTSDGVRVGMPVRAAEGLIGRVIDAGALASRVLLVTDRANIVPARILRGGQPVISTGRGDGTIDVRPLEVGKQPVQARRHHRHLGHRRALSAAGPDRARSSASTTMARSPCRSPTRRRSASRSSSRP